MNRSSFRVILGDLVVSIEGGGELYEKISERMSGFRKAEDMPDADITYRLVPREIMGHFKDFNCRLKTSFFEVGVIKGDPSLVVFTPSIPLKDSLISLLPEYMQKIVYGIGVKRFYSINDLLVEAFIYEVFEWSSCFMLIKKGAAYAHASAVRDCVHNGAYVFAGLSGSGKSTIAAYLSLCCDCFSLFSDNRLIINKKGRACFSEDSGLLRFQTLLSPKIKKALRNNCPATEIIILRSLLALNQKDISKRLHLPENSDGSRSVYESEIKLCFYLRRCKNKGFTMSKMQANDFSLRASNEFFLNHKDLFRYMGEVHGEYLLGIKEELKGIHMAAFAGAECFELKIPENMAAFDLGEAVKDFIYELRK